MTLFTLGVPAYALELPHAMCVPSQQASGRGRRKEKPMHKEDLCARHVTSLINEVGIITSPCYI